MSTRINQGDVWGTKRSRRGLTYPCHLTGLHLHINMPQQFGFDMSRLSLGWRLAGPSYFFCPAEPARWMGAVETT